MAKRILIADDSVTIQKAFAMTFAGADDVTLASARSADEGLAIAQKMHPDLIIADATMPGRSGYDLCASVRSDPALRAVPVLILASSQQPYDEGRGHKAGANGHLLKPWETNGFIEKVRDVLRGEGAHPPSSGVPSSPVPHAPSHRVAASLPTAAIEDDEYGEISIDSGRDTDDQRARVATPPPVDPRSRVATPPPRAPGRISSPSMPAVPISPPPAAPPHASGNAPGSAPTMRPSLIPGMRPGVMPPARPGTMPVRPTGGPAPGPAPGGPPPRPAAAPVGRTMIGLPAANIPIPGVMRPGSTMPPLAGPPPAAPARPPTGPAAPLAPVRAPTGPAAPLAPARSPTGPAAPLAPARPPSGPAMPLAARAPSPATAVSGGIEQRLAAFAAKGPEYEAIAKLSREIIEQIVWEVVPELAEAIIREQVEKRGQV